LIGVFVILSVGLLGKSREKFYFLQFLAKLLIGALKIWPNARIALEV
jgi:hypothetical protein